MKYKITKPDYDGRMFTHHLVMPDGYYRIFSLTRNNHANLESQINRGYLVEEYRGELAAGLYEEDTDLRVDPMSVMEAMGIGGHGTVRYLSQDDADDSETLGLRPRDFRRDKRLRRSPQEERGNRIDDIRDALSAMKVSYKATDSRAALEAKLQKATAGKQ